jgi:hypothetical protein
VGRSPPAAESDAGVSQRPGVDPGRDRGGGVYRDVGSKLVADHYTAIPPLAVQLRHAPLDHRLGCERVRRGLVAHPRRVEGRHLRPLLEQGLDAQVEFAEVRHEQNPQAGHSCPSSCSILSLIFPRRGVPQAQDLGRERPRRRSPSRASASGPGRARRRSGGRSSGSGNPCSFVRFRSLSPGALADPSAVSGPDLPFGAACESSVSTGAQLADKDEARACGGVRARTPAWSGTSGSAGALPPSILQIWSPALADIIGARRAWTVAMISSVSMPWR